VSFGRELLAVAGRICRRRRSCRLLAWREHPRGTGQPGPTSARATAPL